MASVKEHKSHDMGLHQEVLTGRTQQVFFNPEESENFLYNDAYDVDFNKRTSIDVEKLNCIEVNSKIKDLMKQGYGTIVLKNPGAKHSLGVAILNKLNLIIEGSLGYFGVGSIDGPVVRISGRVGWSCAENMMAGKVVIEKNAGSCFGAAIRGGDLICKGSVGARSGIDMKGGTIMIGGNAGAFTGFMMQRGRIVILGDVGPNLGDSLYDGTIFVGGKIPGTLTRFVIEGYREKCETKTVIGPNCKNPVKLDIPIYITSMSFGALSYEAKTALARGATMAGSATCSGEGGMIPDERRYSQLWYYQCIQSRYGFNPHHAQLADGIEVFIGQGQKVGMGGHLMGRERY